jgi:hypothetical protein
VVNYYRFEGDSISGGVSSIPDQKAYSQHNAKISSLKCRQVNRGISPEAEKKAGAKRRGSRESIYSLSRR